MNEGEHKLQDINSEYIKTLNSVTFWYVLNI